MPKAVARSMKSNATACESRDILSSRWRVFWLYWLPAIAIVAVGPLAISTGWRAHHNGHGMYSERAPLWARSLLPHRTVLLPDGPGRIVVRSRHPASRQEQLEPARPNNPGRCHRPVVPTRDVSWKISNRPSRSWQRSLSHFFRFHRLRGLPEKSVLNSVS